MGKKMIKLLFLIFLISFAGQSYGRDISVMAYNVENLFDTKDDSVKSDETFLPVVNKNGGKKCKGIRSKWRKKECEELNWDSKTLDKKMRQIASVILSYNSGKGADILILEEIENLTVLKELNEKYLKKAGYVTAELLEGPDVRGIDTAVLSRFKVKSPSKLHDVIWKLASPAPKRPTRSILEVTLDLGNDESASVFAVHFPSPSHKIEERMDAFRALNIASEKSSSDLIVAGGDFNVTANEDSRLYRALASKTWDVSHLKGCDFCIGTNYYKPYGKPNQQDSWSFLDAILIHKNSKFKFLPESIEVWNTFKGVAEGKENKPSRFVPETGTGFSDHFPIAAKVKK